MKTVIKVMLIAVVLCLIPLSAVAGESAEFANKVAKEHGLKPEQARVLKQLLTGGHGLTRNIGTEDPNEIKGPNNSHHMASRQACIEKVIKTGLIKPNPVYERVCGAKWMAPIPENGKGPESAGVCIDQFEFPNMPCEYPVVWVTSAAAKRICESMGKRVCNSHEWEGACHGRERSLREYYFGAGERTARRAMTNSNRQRVWAFQWQAQHARVTDSRQLCGVYSANDPEIDPRARGQFTQNGRSVQCQRAPGSDYQTCGTNSWPAGFKYECRSQFDVFDMHGNVAEVMNLPASEQEIANGRDQIGGTERKGSFFVYRGDYADDCHVRQPYEHHGNYATDKMSYYQEGFRCCKDAEP
jgi:hypothetical protein